jgi:DNA-binding phage protein
MRQFRPKMVTVPAKSHPVVRRVFEEMIAQQIGYADIAARSGVDRNTIRGWRTRQSPSLANAEAVLGALGLRLTVTKERTRE